MSDHEAYESLTNNAALLVLLREKDEQIRTLRENIELFKETRAVALKALQELTEVNKISKQVAELRESGTQRIDQLVEKVASLEEQVK